MVGSTSQREIRQRLTHCQEAEDVSRFGISQDEALDWDAVVALCARHRRKMVRRLEERQAREDTAVVKAVRTLERRVHGLEHDELRQRELLTHQWGLQIEALLRVLERDIQHDVDSIEYSDMQRVKYFNKTVSVIHKNEGSERRELTNSERYAWLVLVQKFDAATLQLQLTEKLKAFRAQQRRKIERFQQTSSTAEFRRYARQLEEQRRARGIANGKKKRYTQVLPRTDDRHTHGFVTKALGALELRCEESRAAVEAEEQTELDAILRGVDHGEALRAEEVRRTTIAREDGELRAALRHIRTFEREEATARTQLVTEERAGFLAIQRKLQREEVAESRRTMADVTRQVTHQRKLEDRQQRMSFARTNFIERQVLLSHAMRTEPTEQEIFPAFTPRPPEMIAVQQQLQKLSQTQPSTSRRARNDSLQSELGNTANFATARTNVVVRSLQAQAQASRVAVETEERRERFDLLSEANAALRTSGSDRVAAAHERRVAEQLAREAVLNDHMEREGQRSVKAQSSVKAKKEKAKAFDRLGKEELTARIKVKAKEEDWWGRFGAYCEAVAGKRIMQAFASVVATEESARKDLAAAEGRLRQTIRTSAAHHKPQSRVVKVEPLPPPKSKFDIIGAPPRPERASVKGSGSTSGRRKKQHFSETPAGGSTRSSRATSQAATPRHQSRQQGRRSEQDSRQSANGTNDNNNNNNNSRAGTADNAADRTAEEENQPAPNTGNATPPPKREEDAVPEGDGAAADDDAAPSASEASQDAAGAPADKAAEESDAAPLTPSPPPSSAASSRPASAASSKATDTAEGAAQANAAAGAATAESSPARTPSPPSSKASSAGAPPRSTAASSCRSGSSRPASAAGSATAEDAALPTAAANSRPGSAAQDEVARADVAATPSSKASEKAASGGDADDDDDGGYGSGEFEDDGDDA